MERNLYEEYKDLRKKGLKVKKWWFVLRAKEILKETNPESTGFAFTDDWFTGFKRRHNISLGQTRVKKSLKIKDQSLNNFIATSDQTGEEVGPLRKWTVQQVANVDPLPFTFTGGSTYADTGNKTVWVRGGPSGLDKRQCTAPFLLMVNQK